jgi:fermentation-respiration switch protein FrsA (DUF1100 family)
VWFRPLVSAAVLCATIFVTMAWFEESLIFFPDPYPSGEWDTAAVAAGSGAIVTDRFFTAEDGTRLHGWLCRPEGVGKDRPDSPPMTLLWFHGNAGNLAHRADVMLMLSRLPAQVFIVDYRGYGRSEGRPTEGGLYRDARGAWRHLTGDLGVPPKRVVIYGVSLGGGVAVDLAAEVEPAGLIVQSSFTSVPDMARRHYPFVPGWLIRTRMDSKEKIARVSCPVMVAHSPADEVVPFELGRRLFEAARGDVRFVEIPGAAHNETWLRGGDRYFNEIRNFVAHCGAGRREAEHGGE